MIKKCHECKYLNECYPMPMYSNQWAEDLFEFLKATRKKDLCPLDGDITNGCADCAYAGDYKYDKKTGACLRR